MNPGDLVRMKKASYISSDGEEFQYLFQVHGSEISISGVMNFRDVGIVLEVHDVPYANFIEPILGTMVLINANDKIGWCSNQFLEVISETR
jgi:hypothetical protein